MVTIFQQSQFFNMFTSNGHFPIIDSNEIFLVIVMHHGMVQSLFYGFLKYGCECATCVSFLFQMNMTKFIESCEF
jgi:hypothetical protein